jgi:hypothetical protein
MIDSAGRYGVMFFVCAVVGAFFGLAASGSPVISIVGAILGGCCWLAFKYVALNPKI